MYCTSAAFMQGYYSTLMSYLDWKYMYTLYIHVHTVQLYFYHNNPWLVSKQSTEELLLPEGVLWGGYGGDQGVVTGVCVTVRHQVGRCLWYLYPAETSLYLQLLHQLPGLADTHGAVHWGVSFHPVLYSSSGAIFPPLLSLFSSLLLSFCVPL